MKDKLMTYGFTESKYGALLFSKNGWNFEYHDDKENYMWVYAPKGSDEDGICLHNLEYDKIVKLIEFITEY